METNDEERCKEGEDVYSNVQLMQNVILLIIDHF